MIEFCYFLLEFGNWINLILASKQMYHDPATCLEDFGWLYKSILPIKWRIGAILLTLNTVMVG